VGLVHHGVGVIRLHRREIRLDASQTVLLYGGRFRIRHFACAGSPCATTISLSAGGTSVLSERSRIPGAEVRRVFSDRLLMRRPEIQRKAHVVIHAARLSGERSGDEIDERLLDLFNSAVALARREPAFALSRRTAVERVRLLLSERMEDPPRLEELASTVGCTRYHLCRVFKEDTGLTITQYLHRLRLNEAVLRLSAGADDLSTLAVELGYASHSHFTSRFHRCYGITPSAFRDQMRRAGCDPRKASSPCGPSRGTQFRNRYPALQVDRASRSRVSEG
jgi:AraC-like DNA-binding protein